MNYHTRFQRFLLRNRDKGIPNLMLYIIIGCGIVGVLNTLGYTQLYSLLCFDKQLILKGQVWRLFSYVFTMIDTNFILLFIALYCFYSLGRAVESNWGTLKFNLFYLTSILIMDLFAMIFDNGTIEYVAYEGATVIYHSTNSIFYSSYMSSLLHLSLVICFATLYPDNQFLIFFIIPIKAKILSLIYLGYVVYEVVTLTVQGPGLPHNLFPLIAMLPYFLFAGKNVMNLLPLSWRIKRRRKNTTKKAAPQTGSIPFRPAKPEPADFNHKCTVCGRTDQTNPELEFRYCSRCAGYHCYCQDHISNHEHIQ